MLVNEAVGVRKWVRVVVAPTVGSSSVERARRLDALIPRNVRQFFVDYSREVFAWEAIDKAVLNAKVLEVFLLEGAKNVSVDHVQQVCAAECDTLTLLGFASVLFAPFVVRVHCQEFEHEQVDRRSDHRQTE